MELYVWGTSKLSEKVISYLDRPISGFIDNDPIKWGGTINGKPILSPADVRLSEVNIVIASIFYPAIYDQILKLGGASNDIQIGTEQGILSQKESENLIIKYQQHQKWIQNFKKENANIEVYKGEREDFLKYLCSKSMDGGLVIECGVFKGASINVIASVKKQTIYGFDTFTGLPESWTEFHQESFFDLDGQFPLVKSNVKLFKGLFQDTLEPFLLENQGSIHFLHCDADLYSSTKYVLDTCKDRFVTGTIILFDDYLYDLDYEKCDHRACIDFMKENAIEFEYILFSDAGSVAIKIK